MSHDGEDIAALVDLLLGAGRHAEAAAAARSAGDFARAATIYARIWDFRAAAASALEAGDDLGALRHLLDARASDDVAALAREIAARGAEPARAAADVLAGRGLGALGLAAELREQAGDLALAATLYERDGRLLDAARVLAKLDRARDAGKLLERLLAGRHAAPSPETAARAHLALGAILGRLGQHDDAVRHLQAAARHDATRAAALAGLVPELAALGLRDAAADALLAARAVDASLPAHVDAVVARRAGTGRELAGGRYQLLELLGAGGAGRVYRARDEISGAEVAVKLFAVEASQADAYRRFVREARMWTTRRHANLVEVLELREDLGFQVMELLPGGALSERIGEGAPLPPPQVRRLGLDVTAALAHAHAHGVVHRDVKPRNIFFDALGNAKLGDFGVAHLLELGPTQTGALIGTLAYMSPEQITGAPITGAADLYALGVTLFQALTGRLPFVGPDYIAQHLGDAPPRASEIDARVGAWDALLERLLAKEVGGRPASAQALLVELSALEAAPRVVLSLPRTPTAPAAAPAAPAPVAERAPRLEAEAPLGETEVSTLARAHDTALRRTVVLERFAAGHPQGATRERLFALAAASSPHLQRVLDWDAEARVMTFEAALGVPVTTLAPRAACRLLQQLGAALAALDDAWRRSGSSGAGPAHGAIGAGSVFLDDDGSATLAVAGLGQAGAATAADDVAACLALAATASGAASVFEALGLPAEPITRGEELRAWAERADLVLARRATIPP